MMGLFKGWGRLCIFGNVSFSILLLLCFSLFYLFLFIFHTRRALFNFGRSFSSDKSKSELSLLFFPSAILLAGWYRGDL